MKFFNRRLLTGIGFFITFILSIVIPSSNVHAADYPVVVAVSPADGEVRVPINTTIVIQFDKQMDTYSVEDNVEIMDQFENEIQGTFSWSATVHPNDTFTFTPNQSLGYSLSYEIDIEGGCQDAINHHPLNGYWEDVESYFTTVGAPGDDSAPKVITVFPYNGQTGGDTHLIATIFTKTIDPLTATNLNVILSGPSISGYSVNFEYKPFPILMIEPDTPLALHSDYTVTLTTELTDTEGHPLASQYEWSFNTGAGDNIPPTVTQTVPANGAVDTHSGAEVKVYFSENMDPDTITTLTVTVYDETTHVYKDIHINKDDIDESGNRSFIRIKPVFDDRIWTDGHTYNVVVSQTVTDFAENPLGSDYVFTFAVIAYPDVAPDIWGGDSIGIRQPDGSTLIEFELEVNGAHGCDNLTVVATDLTQAGKNWTLTNDPGECGFEYESTGDEGLDVGYHEIEFLVTDTVNGHSTSIRSNFYIFNTAPSLASPLDASRTVSTTPLLSWNANGLVGDDIYRIVIFDGPDPGSANIVWSSFFFADGSSNYSFKLPVCHSLDPNTTYCWAVFAADNHNWIQGYALSPFWSFTTGNDELVVDFGANGLWHYDGSTWSSLASWDPDDGMVEWAGGLAVDFGASYGLWNYNGTTWNQLAGWEPEDGIAWDNGLAVDFGPNGLWQYNGSWTSLASWNPEGMVEWAGGLAVDFGATYGLWNYNGTTWSQLAAWNPEDDMVNWTDGIAVDFGPNGLWNYDGSSWTSLAGWNPDGMVEWAGGLAVDFGPNGLWNYDGSSWTSLAGWNPDGMVEWTGGLAVDFGPTYGLWSYDGSSWTSLAGWNPEEMEAWAKGLAVDFGAAYGLWNYDGSFWSNLAGWDSEDMIDVDLF